MTLKITMVAAAFCVTIAATAQAATLVPVAGDVYDRKGNQGGFQPVSSATEVKAGDTVMTGPNGSAKINFGGGCSISVGAGQTVTVPAQCQAATVEPNPGQYLVGGAVAAVIGTGVYATFKRDNAPPLPVSP